MKGLTIPERLPARRDILESSLEADIFLRAANELDWNCADLMVTQLAVGTRWGEPVGLPVRALHPVRGTVAIQRVLRRKYKNG